MLVKCVMMSFATDERKPTGQSRPAPHPDSAANERLKPKITLHFTNAAMLALCRDLIPTLPFSPGPDSVVSKVAPPWLTVLQAHAAACQAVGPGVALERSGHGRLVRSLGAEPQCCTARVPD